MRLRFESRFAKFVNKDYMMDANLIGAMDRNINFDENGAAFEVRASKMNSDSDFPEDDEPAF